MALTEQRILKQVAVLPNQSAVNVQWANQILRDDELITETYERKAYTADQYSEFLTEVEGAEAYITVLGWTQPETTAEDSESQLPKQEEAA